ncbi:lectin c-type domain-containing protein [Phthorimaea operculella]|nr:lectin c-type domain-containing protein [Phthorimaea operculella]
MEKIQITVFVIVSVAVIYGKCETPEGYTVNAATGHAYKLVYKAENWTNARHLCAKEGAKLTVPKSKEEFQFIQKIVRGMQFPNIIGASNYKLLVWVGVSNLDDYKVWKNIDGENIEDTGFHDWAGLGNGQNPQPGPKEPHCVGIDAQNPGYREFWCHLHQAYICERKI